MCKRVGDSSGNRYYGKNHLWTDDKTADFIWNIKVSETDEYEIFATLPGDVRAKRWKIHPESDIPFSKAALYKINSKEFVVDQSKADGGWIRIGSLKLDKGRTHSLVLTNNGNGRIAADAIRLESKTRRNDGTILSSVNIAPNDGIILLK